MNSRFSGFCWPRGWAWVRLWPLPHCHCALSSPKVFFRCARLACQAALTVWARPSRCGVLRSSHQGEAGSAARRGRAASRMRVCSRLSKKASPSSSRIAALASS
ncbi:hypothetical protein D3C78_1651590 [compost metagenome]